MMTCINAKKQCETEKNLPQSVVKALEHCTDFLSNIKKTVTIVRYFVVTSVTRERTFLVLKRLKTYLKVIITKERLNGICSS